MGKPFKGKIILFIEANVEIDDEKHINRELKENWKFHGAGGSDFRYDQVKLIGWKKKPKQKKK